MCSVTEMQWKTPLERDPEIVESELEQKGLKGQGGDNLANDQQRVMGISKETSIGSSHRLSNALALRNPPRNSDPLCERQEVGDYIPELTKMDYLPLHLNLDSQ